ncbi:MAG TPA: YetF domain-containing protein [Gemmatimonadaceae bacterium]
MFSTSWKEIGSIIGATSIIFVFIVALLRLTGPQALAKMSIFDLVFAVSIGSVIGAVAVSEEVSVPEGAVALVCLLALQELIRFLQARFLSAHHAVRQVPRVLLWDGQLLKDRLLANQISADEIRAAVRKSGHSSLDVVQAVVLENDGDWSVILKQNRFGDDSAFDGLPIPGIPGHSRKSGGHKAEPVGTHARP